MDPLNPPASTLSCISAVKNRRRKAPNTNVYVSMRIPQKRLYFTPPFRSQRWSLPESIIFYMAKNPRSPKVYQKLTKSCKYFHAINPIIVCSKLTYIVPENTDGGNDVWKIKQSGEHKIIELNNASTKLWVNDEILIDNGDDDAVNIKPNLASSVIPNIYCCGAEVLKLYCQSISFEEYKFLASNVKYIILDKVAVQQDGSIISFEKLVEAAVNVIELIIWFDFNDASVTSYTVKNLMNIPHFSRIKYLGMCNIPATFDLDTWFTYAKKNKSTFFLFGFPSSVSEAYKNRLEEIIDEIIATQNHQYYPPRISFPELDRERYYKLREISMTYCDRF